MDIVDVVDIVKGLELEKLFDYFVLFDVVMLFRIDCFGYLVKIFNYMCGNIFIVGFIGVVKGLYYMKIVVLVEDYNVEEFVKFIVMLLDEKDKV